MKDDEVLPAWVIWDLERLRPLEAFTFTEMGEELSIPLADLDGLERDLASPEHADEHETEDVSSDGRGEADRGVFVIQSPWL